MHNALKLFAIFAVALYAEQPQPRPIPAELYGEVYRAQVQYIQAKTALDAAVSALVQFCGAKASPTIDMVDVKKNVCEPKIEPASNHQ